MSTKLGFSFLAFALFASSALHAAETCLAISGEVKAPLRLSLPELKSMPLTRALAKDDKDTAATYEGVSLAELLHRAGVPQGGALRRGSLRLGVLVKAADGYQALFSLAELDPAMTDKTVLLAYTRDGAALDAAAGPLRLIVPDEKRQARWVRQVNELEVVRVGAAKPANTPSGR